MQDDGLAILRRRSELVTVVVSAVVMGVSANVIAACLIGQAPLKYLPIPVVAIVVSLSLLARHFLKRPVSENVQMVLLIDREGEGVVSSNYQLAVLASSALGRLKEMRPEVFQAFDKELLEGGGPVLRDLIEYIVVCWLQSTRESAMTPDGRVVFPYVPLPEPGKVVQGRDVLGKFGKNVFADVLSDMPNDVIVPRSVTLTAKRYESKEVKISMAVGDEPLFMRVIGGQVGGSELILKGSFWSPLDFFSVRTFVERVSPGVNMCLFLQGLVPVMNSPEKVVCKEKATGEVRIIEGEKLKELKKWVEVDCRVIVTYRMKGVLSFFHRGLGEWSYWCESMKRHASHWFGFTPPRLQE